MPNKSIFGRLVALQSDAAVGTARAKYTLQPQCSYCAEKIEVEGVIPTRAVTAFC